MTQPDALAFPGSFFTTTEYAEVWGEDWDLLFQPDTLDKGYDGTGVLLVTT